MNVKYLVRRTWFKNQYVISDDFGKKMVDFLAKLWYNVIRK